ncbi:MAG: acyl-CoA dehydrogenase [Gammaproteobacteria bacterium]|jgi:alkylation response protein AidB-like acyl-CoA dehydrogenase|nr:acyl-CoA dehydrogenase [Gammaproteobacteria bacterium]
MSLFLNQIEGLQLQLQLVAELEAIMASEKFSHVDREMIDMMLDQSARFAEEKLVALAESGDIAGCKLENGNVSLPPGTPEVYQQWCELGFPALGLPMDFDGLDFPNIVQSAVQEILDGANIAFGMLGINLRCAARALIANASDDLIQRWVPGLVSGEISSTIVISEPQAGSDVGRIRTSASPGEDNKWMLNGSKIWISFGDHDATEQIIHLVLARVPGDEIGTRALGLFAVPKYRDDEISEDKRNPVNVSRLEHKMGLHGSPTCVLEFDNAEGYLIGAAGKGLQALFIMMNGMRLAVGVQGSAVANTATLRALEYAQERPQGGRPDSSPVMISEHADVKRMLLEMTAKSEMIRALTLRTAAYLDLAEATDDAEAAQQYLNLGELLLPIAKTIGSETAFQVANQGIQVLGGYGYTNDYPIERMVRDIRVSSIYEGTSGIQALDFLKRKVLGDEGRTLTALLTIIRQDITGTDTDNPLKAGVDNIVQAMASLLDELLDRAATDRKSVEPGAYHFLCFSGLLVTHWLGMLLYRGALEETDYQQRLKAALALSATGLNEEAGLLAKLSLQAAIELRL